MMKCLKVMTVLALVNMAFGSAQASQCEAKKGCERKFCEIQQQIDVAKRAQNQYQVQGLESALHHAQQNCTDAKLRRELEEDIRDAEEDIAEYQEDLKKAQRDGDQEKIRKYQRKIEEERAELEASRKEKQLYGF